jgi:hypothetical protein
MMIGRRYEFRDLSQNRNSLLPTVTVQRVGKRIINLRQQLVSTLYELCAFRTYIQETGVLSRVALLYSLATYVCVLLAV